MSVALPVRSVDEEENLIGTCGCGSPWRLALNSVEPVSGKWHDIVGVRCPICGRSAGFTFDVTTFFQPRPGIWGRDTVLVPAA